MKIALLPLALAAISLLVGCSTAPRSVEAERDQLASKLGMPEKEITFVANADFAPVGELTEGFTPGTKGIVALTADALIWCPGQGDDAEFDELRKISFADIDGFSSDGGFVQVRFEGETYLLRLTDWNRFQASQQMTANFFEEIYDRKLPIFVKSQSYALMFNKGERYNSGVLYEDRTTEDVMADEIRDREHYQWVSTFGDEGVPTREPGRRLSE
ncbi:MAG: hypothetical protein SynsKO_41580 [Synoicihabitans sp.]